jgi:DNA (cytosine-5)-methyltransferase 1
VVIDAALFVPQSRPRLFIVAVDTALRIPAALVASGPTAPFHPPMLIAACLRQRNPIWWRLPTPPTRNTTLIDLLEDPPRGVNWHTEAETNRLLEMMSPVNVAKVEAAKCSRRRIAGTAFRRMRDGDGGRIQRTEARFDEIAGCLRIPTGGSSRQFVIIVAPLPSGDGAAVRSRLLSPRESARLMGLGEDYQLPANTNEALFLTGDGVVVPVVRFLAEHLFEPILRAPTRTTAGLLEAAP